MTSKMNKLFILIFLLFTVGAQCRQWDVFADLLVWNISEQTMSTWASTKIATSGTTVYTADQVYFDWNPGFRGGVGYKDECGLWDTQLYWTYFSTRGNDSIPQQGLNVVIPEFFAGFISTINDFNLFYSAAIQWRILYNMFDWELGRTFKIASGKVLLRPFIGIKGGAIYQKIDTELDALIYIATENLHNNFWGIGPSAGMNGKWNLVCNNSQFFSLLGGVSTAMMRGTWMISDVYNDPLFGENISVNLKKSELGALMFRGFMGLEWSTLINESNSRLTLQLGYEMQLWLNQLRLPTFQLFLLHGDLAIQGGTCGCRIDF
ncbi:MAG: Lpg1974 family pore-forming outer membrane protein [Chlamydiales bacterium]|nr:Lpg1974 family pore-forming outer membrane protein [Chlamydiales bacterium]